MNGIIFHILALVLLVSGAVAATASSERWVLTGVVGIVSAAIALVALMDAPAAATALALVALAVTPIAVRAGRMGRLTMRASVISRPHALAALVGSVAIGTLLLVTVWTTPQWRDAMPRAEAADVPVFATLVQALLDNALIALLCCLSVVAAVVGRRMLGQDTGISLRKSVAFLRKKA